jgi:AraC family transcriptional regulator
MYRELSISDFGSQANLESLAKQLAIEIARKFASGRSPDHYSSGLAPWRMKRLYERLYSEGPLPDLAELATLCGMSIRHLSRTFRTETGQTLGKYIDAVMVERATEMLAASTPIGETAKRLGFAGPSSFRSAFRRATGLLPSEIKASARPRTACNH